MNMKVSDFVNEMRGTSVVFGRETGVYVTFEGDGAYTDGKRINLPSMGLDKTLTPKQVKTMRGYVDHEAGHVRHSDMPLIMDFYSRCGANNKMDLKTLHNCIEDVWMEHKVVSCYSGSLKNLAQTNESVSEAEVESFKDPEGWLKKKGWSQERITEALAMTPPRDLTEFTVGNLSAALKKNNPMYSSPKFNEFKGMLGEKNNEWAQHFIPMILECRNSQDTIDLAMDIWKMFEDNSQEDLDDMETEDFEKGSGDPLESVGEPGEEVQEGYGEGQQGSDGSGDGEGEGVREVMPEDYLPSSEEMVGEALRGENTDGQGSIGSCGDGPLTGGYKVTTTENDTTYKRGGDRSKGRSYVWDIIESNDTSTHQQVMAQIAGPINVMSGKLRRALLAKKRVDREGGRQIGRLDSKRLVAASQGADNVFYQRVDRKEEDTAVTILGDLSGSMGGRKAVVTRDCIVALSECLDGGAMPFKVVGFCNKSWGSNGSWSGSYHRYEPLDTVVFKDYNKPLKTCRASVAQFDKAVGGNNSDYDFITQEISELRKRPEQRKVLFVLSDGHPACESDASTSEHVRLCKEAINQARKEGIECVGIGICDDAVQEIYKDHVVVHDVKDLSTTVFNKLTNLLVGD